ncbi:hypothetical protein ABE67_13955 [Cytobacillus firmus]|uniref:hypothetical protein n=1 Tax=Cytobacillus firmus TaxID=1399 RepID=UPI0018CE0886|nr:hypothetical protein [Cytobacillus firmus]MBG9450402.1 hypothetical protein [Cytobacillus firmus]
MDKVKPIQTVKNKIPVNIYINENLVVMAESIKDAAEWLKNETSSTNYKWKPINDGIWDRKPYSYNGNTYKFFTDPSVVKDKSFEKKAL